ncbi:MAG: VWA domain-containing protein, partial [Thermoanaerobaculia bacterium]
DETGDVLTDLERGMFRVWDEGEKATIVGFRKVFEDPISFALVVDASNSMSEFMTDVTEAAANFVERSMRDTDRAAVYSIHNVPRQWQQLTGDQADVTAALAKVTCGGNTALWDALNAALRELRPETNRRAIVLLSDGEDTHSMTEWAEIIREIRLAAVPIYVIAFGPDGKPGRHADRLRYLAAESGGFVVNATTEQLAQAYKRIEEDLRARYALEYEVFAPTTGSEWRSVKVSVAEPKWTTRSIKGYFAR